MGHDQDLRPVPLSEHGLPHPHPSEKNPGFSTVEVRFTALGDDRTRVELKQSNWEALGEVAKMVQGGYRQAWVMIFEGAYKAACGG